MKVWIEELQQYFSDLLFRVNLQTGHPAYVYILLEHKSYVECMLSYISSANANVSPTELKRSLEIAFPQEGDQFMATMAQQWLEEGKQQALITSIREGLEIRFSVGFEPLLREIEKIQDPAKLQRLLNLLFKATSLAEFQEAYRLSLLSDAATNGAHLN